MGLNRWLGCIENPWTGREALGPARLVRRRRPKRLLVVGAGPGGLQAAVSAAEAGHRVTVWEQGDEPGGQVRLAATVPNRAELGDLVRNLVGECRRLGIEIQLGRKATVGSVLAEGPDAVVVATGSRPARPWWAPPDDDRIVDVVDVVRGDAQPSGDVVVIDEVGFHQATSVAELLADRGCAVEILTPAMLVGQDLGITLDLETWWYRAEAKGIVQTTDSVIVGLESGPAAGGEVDRGGVDGGGANGGQRAGRALTVLHHPTGVTRSRTFDWCVLAVPAAPEDELYHALVGGTPEVIRVGDCVAPRRAHAAVVEGRRAGAAL
jgi:2,4-dienoyl-CoA reductase (NADPH2)